MTIRMMIPTKKPITIPWMPAKKKPRADAKNMSTILSNNILKLILSRILATESIIPIVSDTFSDIKRTVAPQFGHFSPGPVLMNWPHFLHLITLLSPFNAAVKRAAKKRSGIADPLQPLVRYNNKIQNFNQFGFFSIFSLNGFFNL